MNTMRHFEDRSQSHGQEIRSRRDDLLAIHALAERRPAPSDVAVQVLLFELQARGLSLSVGEAEAIVRRVLVAEDYRPTER